MTAEGRITRKYTLEDIIRDEAARIAAKQSPGTPAGQDGLGMLGISNLKDITDLLREINKAATIFGKGGIGQQPEASHPVVRLPPGEGGSINKEEGGISHPGLAHPTVRPDEPRALQAVDYGKVVDQIIGAFDAFIATMGDIKLSEARQMIDENRDAVAAMVRAQMEVG